MLKNTSIRIVHKYTSKSALSDIKHEATGECIISIRYKTRGDRRVYYI